jgi:hypothetical protein
MRGVILNKHKNDATQINFNVILISKIKWHFLHICAAARK